MNEQYSSQHTYGGLAQYAFVQKINDFTLMWQWSETKDFSVITQAPTHPPNCNMPLYNIWNAIDSKYDEMVSGFIAEFSTELK